MRADIPMHLGGDGNHVVGIVQLDRTEPFEIFRILPDGMAPPVTGPGRGGTRLGS